VALRVGKEKEHRQ